MEAARVVLDYSFASVAGVLRWHLLQALFVCGLLLFMAVASSTPCPW